MVVQTIHKYVRALMRGVAWVLHKATGGRISPNGVTIFGTLMHVPIAWLIATEHFMWAAGLLVVFGLFDTLDGELARLQHRATARGMVLDASTDRIKESMLYTGVTYALATGAHPATAAWAAAALGASVSVSYVKAKGEAAVASAENDIPHHVLNRMFGGGILSFEIRIILLIAGLVSGLLDIAAALVAVGAGLTIMQRLIRISKRL